MGEKARGLITHHVFLLDGRLRLLHDTAGPTLGTFGAFGVRGFEMYNDMEPSPFELPNAKMSLQLDLTPRVLWWTAAILSCMQYKRYPSR
jgi:hypothetical protein